MREAGLKEQLSYLNEELSTMTEAGVTYFNFDIS